MSFDNCDSFVGCLLLLFLLSLTAEHGALQFRIDDDTYGLFRGLLGVDFFNISRLFLLLSQKVYQNYQLFDQTTYQCLICFIFEHDFKYVILIMHIHSNSLRVADFKRKKGKT
uniref:Uncharacterized protein n=1 Tax=Glossina austeni TaxID=7395 RepID=A0A1A9UEJ7_GLOAU